jgi:hypothetical protein
MDLLSYWNYLFDHRKEVLRLVHSQKMYVDKKLKLLKYTKQLAAEIERVSKLVTIKIELNETIQTHQHGRSGEEPNCYTIGDLKRADAGTLGGDAISRQEMLRTA